MTAQSTEGRTGTPPFGSTTAGSRDSGTIRSERSVALAASRNRVRHIGQFTIHFQCV